MTMKATLLPGGDQDLELTRQRLERNTRLALVAMMGVALLSGKLNVILGVALGGVLGIINYRWLSTSLSAILDAAGSGRKVSRMAAAKFILRFIVMGGAIAAAFWSRAFDLLSLVAGFCAFIVAAMIEAGYQIYLLITGRGV